MCQRRALLLGLLTALFVGCATNDSARPRSWLGRMRPFQGPTGSDVVQLYVALVDRPAGDSYINEKVWALTDEQVVPLERKALLEDNGFRIGQVGGITPAGLQTLLTSEKSCANPRLLQLHAGSPTRPLILGPAWPRCQFQLHQENQATPISFDQAQCTLVVVPALTSDGRTRLQFTPHIQHGAMTLVTRALGDGSGHTLLPQRPTEIYSALSWEVTLAANDYVIIGTRSDHPDTLGHRCFTYGEPSNGVQRLLVIRTSRVQGAGVKDQESGIGDQDSKTPACPCSLTPE